LFGGAAKERRHHKGAGGTCLSLTHLSLFSCFYLLGNLARDYCSRETYSRGLALRRCFWDMAPRYTPLTLYPLGAAKGTGAAAKGTGAAADGAGAAAGGAGGLAALFGGAA